jgi:predicted metal-dependent HD superfamily phosphohydrolase
MAEFETNILSDAQVYVTDLLSHKLSKSIRFHTLQHTQEVVAACQKLATHSQLAAEDQLALSVASWFHDTGYTSGQAKDHEMGSVQIATDFLTAHNATDELKKKVMGCINATKMPQSPANTIEEIICDADLYHLGTETFKEKSRLLRDEIKEFGGEDLSKKEWRQNNIAFLEAHQYFTDYGRKKLQAQKEKHLADLKNKKPEEVKNEKEKDKEKGRETEKDKLKDKTKKPELTPEAAEAKIKREKEKEADRSIATVFRIMANNHMALSQMADSKANILISVNAIILSILIGSLIEKIQTDPNLQLPLGVIALVCVASIVFGILATRPNVSSGKFSHEDIASKRTNLLFFGNFHNVSLEDYNWGMTEMLEDKEYMNSSMIKDNYFLGVVLAKKYKYLRIAYNIFMYGLILAVIAFIVAAMLPSTTEIYT